MSALRRLRKDFEDDALQYPDLFYAALHGEAFKRGGVHFKQPNGTYRAFEDYVIDHVAERQPYAAPAGYKYPRYFFFGADAFEGATRLAIRCQIAKQIVDDGLRLVSTKLMHRGLEGGLLPHHGYLDGDGVPEHEWMFWMMELGKATDHALLKPRTEPPQIQDSFRTVTGTRHQIFVPCLTHLIMLHQFGPDGTRPEWEYATETARDGTFEAVTLFKTPVFYASTIMVDEVIRMASQRSAANGAADAAQPRPDGFYRPRTIVYLGAEHACEVTDAEAAFLNVALKRAEVSVHALMHPNDGIAFRERYVSRPDKRNKISQFLSRLSKRLANANPAIPIQFSLPRGQDFVVRDDPRPQ